MNELKCPVNEAVLNNYMKNLVNMFFKILPMKENGEDTLGVYLCGLQSELIGCGNVIEAFHNDARFLSLISILQYMIDHPDCETKDVKRGVFSAISMCNKITKTYLGHGERMEREHDGYME